MSEQNTQRWCGQCGSHESQGQASASFQGTGRKGKREEKLKKVRSKKLSGFETHAYVN